ncbi:MAG: hypothetical protein APR54_04810 [Candidatus Cloacimonas sp. SDB]|nr:MAG: hypothetical protein APR54_04810 [Candidatus Cloacimonas sp. SDB]
MKKFLIFIIISCNIFLVASTTAIDSLETLLESASGEKKVIILNQLAEKHRYINPQKSIEYGVKAYKLASDSNYNSLKSEALNNIATGHYYLGNYRNAIEKQEEALKINTALNDKLALARSLNNIGLVYKKLGNYEIALNYILRSLAIEEESENAIGIAQSLCNMGNIYFEMSDFDKSLEFYQRSLIIYEELADRRGIADILNNIGSVYDEKGKYDIALDYYLNSLDYEVQLEDKTGIATTSNNIGLTYYNIDLYDKALEYLNWSLNLTLEIGEKYGIANSYINLGEIYLAMRKYTESRNNLQMGLRLSTQIEAGDLMMAAYKLLSELDTELKNYQKALENHKLYLKQREILFENNRIDITEIHEQFELHKKDQEINYLHQRLKLYWLLNIISIGIIIFITFLFIVTRKKLKSRYIQRQEEINNQLRELAQTDHLTNLANRRGMLEKIQYEKYRFERSKNPFAIIMCDIDSFKTVNDKFGHECGDFVLSSISNLFISLLRKQDLVGRWGGEEFIMLLPETDLENGRLLAEKIRKRVNENAFYYKGSYINITITLGVAVFDEITDIKKTIQKADEALYEGKRRGKNCIV